MLTHALTAGAAVVALVYVRDRKHPGAFPLAPHADDRREFLYAVRTASLLLYVPVIQAMMSPHDRSVVGNILPSAAWMTAVWWLDTRCLEGTPDVKGDPGPFLRAVRRGVRIDPAAVITLSFGLCNLNGIRAESQYMHMFIVALFLCTLGANPTPLIPEDDAMFPLVTEAQRTMLLYSIGMIVTAVCCTRRSMH